MNKETPKKTQDSTAYIPPKRLDEFIALFEKHTGKHLSREQALEKAIKLVRGMELIYRPIAKREFVRLLVRRFILNEKACVNMNLKFKRSKR